MHEDIERALVFVAECADDRIKLVCRSDHFVRLLAANGFVHEPLPGFYADIFGDTAGMYFARTFSDEHEKARALGALRDLGIPFSGGRGWNPCEVFEYLRGQGLVSGGYLEIAWQGPGRHFITERA